MSCPKHITEDMQEVMSFLTNILSAQQRQKLQPSVCSIPAPTLRDLMTCVVPIEPCSHGGGKFVLLKSDPVATSSACLSHSLLCILYCLFVVFYSEVSDACCRLSGCTWHKQVREKACCIIWSQSHQVCHKARSIPCRRQALFWTMHSLPHFTHG